MTGASVLDAALAYADRGWPVFPCRADNKRPHTEHGFHDASTDPDVIRGWWRRWPDAMAACPTGPAVGAWVLDVDEPSTFEAAARGAGLDLPATAESETGKGFHLWFAWDDACPMRNAQRDAKGWPFADLPGAEVRGEGGYVILPPSRHPSGKAYAWRRDETPSEAPEELLDLIARGRPHAAKETPRVHAAPVATNDTAYGLSALDGECAAIRSAGPGGQEAALNHGALKIGSLVAGGQLSADTARSRLLATAFGIASHNLRDPWSPEQLAAKVERGLRDGAAQPRTAPDRVIGRTRTLSNDDYGADASLIKAAERFGGQPRELPLAIAATPYAWCDPAAIPPRRWVYGRSIQRGHLRAVVAQGAAGKTILSVGEALAMVTGRNLLGQEVPGGQKRVWLWNLEDDREELSRIIQAACKHWSISAADLAGRLFVDSALDGATLKLATSTPSAGLVINRPLVEELTREMRDRGIDYLHVDPFVSSHAANESDNMEIDAIAKEWALVAKNADAAVGVAHHVSKAGAAEATALSARGAVALVNACRSVLTLNRMSEEEARMWGIEDERRRRFFRVYDDKNNRAPPSDKSDWFTMASVSLGNGDNDEGDSMGVVLPWSPPDAFEGVTADHLLTVQRAVHAKTGADRFRSDSQAKAWVGKAVAEIFGLSAESSAKTDRARINKLLGTWFANGALVRVEGKDEKSNDRTFVEVGTWAVQDISPTSSGEVGRGGEKGRPTSPHPTCPPIGAGVGKGGPQAEKPGVGMEGEEAFIAGNPALGRLRQPVDFSQWEGGA